MYTLSVLSFDMLGAAKMVVWLVKWLQLERIGW